MRRLILIVGVLISAGFAMAQPWADALARMPLGPDAAHLTWTNCAQTLLSGFQSNGTVKALIFMPGATDELFFFRRVQTVVTNPSPSLMDAVIALTNQSPLRATFRAPFLLLHSDEDVLNLAINIKHKATVEKLKETRRPGHLLFYDRDWDYLLIALGKSAGVKLRPEYHSPDSWHFYRHTFAAWNLTGWEMMQAAALAGKTRFTVQRKMVEFEPDLRIGVLPKLDHFP